jgi:hypothetical protein
MPEVQRQPDARVSEKEGKPNDAPLRHWTLRATHRHPAVVWLIVLLIVLQLVLGGIVIVQAQKLVDLGARIDRLEQYKR